MNNPKDYYNEKHANEWMEKHPYGWYNSECDYGTGDEDDNSSYDEYEE